PLKGRHYHSATWTGSEVVFFGGYNYHRSFRDGAAYDPALDSWRRIPRAPVGARFLHGALWTGTKLLVFGGTEAWRMSHGDGALFDPVTNQWERLVPEIRSASDR
ncbi:MAG: hypothetical protein GEU71_15820, partial [Actinobacteria bacterium]|nr:hypothetical protein [Actinomycetota bacterium]